MRRQARMWGGGARVVRPASALQVWLWLLIFVFQNELSISKSIQPGYLDFDNLPETNFTCEGKVIGGYYADLETSCQMFHVCTVGQQDEPMDIKFLCLNGTVFDQETRVCERVDEVDCTKSEKFYSLNLELYGSTIAPPIIKVNQTKPQSQSTEQPHNTEKPQDNEESDPSIEDSQDSLHHKPDAHAEYQDSTEDPVQEVKNEQTQKPHDAVYPTNAGPEHVEPVEENQEEEEIDSELPDYDEDYTQSPPTTTQLPSTTTTTTAKPPTTPSHPITTSPYPSPNTNPLSSPSPSHPSLISPTHSTGDANPTLDPASLTPQEFIYRHRGPGSEAISFQRQGFRPADGVYITHAPPQQFDHFQYESSRTAPRPPQPVPFVKRPSPAPFRATTIDPREQLLRPGPSSPTLRPGQASQPSERHETSVQHRPHPHPAPLPAQRPLPFDPYYYERKRSDDPGVPEENESTLSARSVGPPVLSVNRPVPQPKYKSPPRVIVTASASVSDSNGKRLNYTVGNVVSAVKPIVPINYDDYKESDLIFDPFFLDVPKLQKRRKSRGSRSNQKVIPLRRTFSDSVLVITTTPRVTSQATTTERGSQTKPTPKQSTTTPAWNQKDYVDDNYEPQIYADKLFPHLAVETNREKWDKEKKPTRDMKGYSKFKYDPIGLKVPSSTQSSSSQIPPVVAPAAAPSLIVEPPCVFADCRNNA